MPSQHEGIPAMSQEQSAQNQAILRGIEVLRNAGIGLHVAGVVLKGPRPECEATLAEMMGSEVHTEMKDSLLEGARDAVSQGLDPGQVLLDGLRFSLKRDDNMELVYVDLDFLDSKKK